MFSLLPRYIFPEDVFKVIFKFRIRLISYFRRRVPYFWPLKPYWFLAACCRILREVEVVFGIRSGIFCMNARNVSKKKK